MFFQKPQSLDPKDDVYSKKHTYSLRICLATTTHKGHLLPMGNQLKIPLWVCQRTQGKLGD